jgi:hypothetical protein
MQLMHKNEIEDLHEKIGNIQITSDSWERSYRSLLADFHKDIKKLRDVNRKDRAIAQDLHKKNRGIRRIR